MWRRFLCVSSDNAPATMPDKSTSASIHNASSLQFHSTPSTKTTQSNNLRPPQDEPICNRCRGCTKYQLQRSGNAAHKMGFLHRHLINQFKGKVWMETTTHHQAHTAIDPGLRLNHRDPHSWPLRFIDEHRVKNLRFSGSRSRSSRQNPKKQTYLKKTNMVTQPSLNMNPLNPFMPIYYPPPPPVSPTGFPPPPPAELPPSQGNLPPWSPEETFNRPTTHLLHTYPTWPSEGYEAPDSSVNSLYGNTPTSYSEMQNIPTKSSSSNIYPDTPEQATGFPPNYFQPPPDVVVRIQTPETSLDWNIPALPQFTCLSLLGEIYNLHYSGIPIRMEIGTETTENMDTCLYVKQMLIQDRDLDWKVTISDDIGQILWENKCLPGSTFFIRYGYHVVFEGLPSMDVVNIPTMNVVSIHDNSKIANIVPVPRNLLKRTWTEALPKQFVNLNIDHVVQSDDNKGNVLSIYITTSTGCSFLC
ncbi:uncharacterized protein [Amphiura filiformis]|uniref:uncharacterized protein n=1 Tax=Amphiura filiformis TaxID=82378 RepID=UPI003B21D470